MLHVYWSRCFHQEFNLYPVERWEKEVQDETFTFTILSLKWYPDICLWHRFGRLINRVCWKIFFFTKVFVPWPKMCDWVQLTRRKKLNWNPWPGTVSKIVVFFTKAFVKKYKGKIDISVFCIFCFFFSILRAHYPIDQFV